MAICRESKYCHKCGVIIRERHTDMGKYFVGDTFIGYEDHICNTNSEAYKNWLARETAYRNSPEGKKHAADIKKMFDGIKEKAKAIAEAEANEALKAERRQIDELNEFLRELADNDKVGIRRKIVAIKRYIAYIENGSTDK